MNLKQKWKQHLQDNSMTYWQHLKFAVGHGLCCIKAGVYLCVHGFLPCFRRRAGSRLVMRLNKDFKDHRYDIYNEKIKKEAANNEPN